MADVSPELVRAALGGERAAVDRLIAVALPVIHARVARALLRRSGASGNRDVRQEVEDMVQDVFLALFDQEGHMLRRWDPTRGMAFKGFVGLVAEQRVAATLRSRRKSPWTEDPTLEEGMPASSPGEPGLERRLWARDELARLMDAVRAELSPRGMDLFQRLLIKQQPIEEVVEETGMTSAALYAWRSRLRKLVKRLAQELGDEASQDSKSPTGTTGTEGA